MRIMRNLLGHKSAKFCNWMEINYFKGKSINENARSTLERLQVIEDGEEKMADY